MASANTTMTEVQVSVEDLQIGMYVSRLDKDWIDSPFLFQGFLIANEGHIRKLQKECQHVYIDLESTDPAIAASFKPKLSAAQEPEKKSGFSFSRLFGKKTAEPEKQRPQTNKLADIIEHKIESSAIAPPPKLLSFDQEMKQAKAAYAETDLLIKEFMSKVKEGSAIDILVAKQTVHDYMASILRSPDAMLLITRLKRQHKAAWQHSMNVCVLAINLGRYLNLADNELVTLGMCGLFHDIGKVRIPKEELVKKDEEEIIREHTTLGRDILLHTQSQGPLGQAVAEVAYSHHEKLDGSGLPQGLRGKEISAYTRMITVVDTYDSLTNDKAGRRALTHYNAITLMLKLAGKQLDETLVNSFNQCIGTYPVGCVVEMNTGEIAIVVEENETQKLRPKVMLLTTPDKQPCPKTVINLAETSVFSNANLYTIKGIVLPEKYGLKI